MKTEADSRPSEGRESAPANPVKLPVYLDNHATTPLDPRVLEAMLPYLQAKFGNPSSRSHAYGWEASKAVEAARDQVATLIGAEPGEIVFTSGATESDNLAIKGVAEARRGRGRHVVTVLTEHKAVLDSCNHLEDCGFEVTFLSARHDSCNHHGGEQRDRSAPADCRDWRNLPPTRDPVPHRCRAGSGESSTGC